jgi:hypothetical protein
MTHSHHRSDRRRPRTASRPALEALEGRQLMSLGTEFSVNSQRVGDQFSSVSAGALTGGSTVVAWTTTFSPTDHDIHAQIYRSNGTPLGTEITLADTFHDERDPALAVGRDGTFVLAYTETEANGDTNVLARRFSSTGVQIGAVVPVGVGTFKEHNASVAIDLAGDFVVAYTRDTNNNNPDIFAKRYNSNGQLLGVLNVATSAKAETHASVAISPAGDKIDVAYQLAFGPTDDDVLLARFSGSGQLLGTSPVATSTAREQAPSLAMDSTGQAVIAYQKQNGASFDIQARRVNASGVLGPVIDVASTRDDELNPSVALQHSGGRFVVAYDQLPTTFPGRFNNSVYVAEFSATNQELADSFAGLDRGDPSVAFGGANGSDYLVSYTNFIGNASDPGEGIRGRRGHVS